MATPPLGGLRALRLAFEESLERALAPLLALLCPPACAVSVVNARLRSSGSATRSRRMLAPAPPRAPAWVGCMRYAARQRCRVGRSQDGLARVTMRVPLRPHMGGARLASCGAPGDSEAAPGGSEVGRRYSTATPGVSGASVANTQARTRHWDASRMRTAHMRKVGDMVEIVSPVCAGSVA